jgi:dTDP-4-amino-4,6-dideoxygalactose transaminase
MKNFGFANVMARRYFYPGCHRMEPYRSYYPHAGLLLPATEAVASRVLLLPTGTAMDEARIRELCAILRLAVEQAPRVEALRKGRAARTGHEDDSSEESA